MTDVRVLELAGDDDASYLNLRQDMLKTLAGSACEPSPTFRLLELCAPSERGSIAFDEGPASVPRVRRLRPAQIEATAEEILGAFFGDDVRFLDSASVGRQLSGNPDLTNPKKVTTRARREHRIFGAWHGNAFRYPTFQFDTTGQPRAALPELLEVLPRDENNEVGRDAALWVYTPDAMLDDRTPAEVFSDNPGRVIALARTRRDGGDAVD